MFEYAGFTYESPSTFVHQKLFTRQRNLKHNTIRNDCAATDKYVI